MFKLLTPLLFLLISTLSHSQTYKLTGRVTAFDSIPLKNIQVEATKAKTLAVTDSLGFFTIESNEKKEKLEIKADQFKKETVKLKGSQDNILQVELDFNPSVFDLKLLEENGMIDINFLPLVNAHLKSLRPDFCSYNDIYDLIENNLVGVMVNYDISEPAVILHRTNSAATFMVDGLIRSSIMTVHPCDVESIDLIKDASTLSLYGTEAGAGIISIKTKTAE